MVEVGKQITRDDSCKADSYRGASLRSLVNIYTHDSCHFALRSLGKYPHYWLGRVEFIFYTRHSHILLSPFNYIDTASQSYPRHELSYFKNL